VSKAQVNLQDSFLNQVRRDNIPVTIYLVNGYQLKGFIKGFDNFTVVLENDGKQQLVYKHALSTIAPLRPVHMLMNLPQPRESESEA
jgi:host factor-I protein